MNCTREESRPARVVAVVPPEVVGQFNRMGETGVMQEEIHKLPRLEWSSVEKARIGCSQPNTREEGQRPEVEVEVFFACGSRVFDQVSFR